MMRSGLSREFYAAEDLEDESFLPDPCRHSLEALNLRIRPHIGASGIVESVDLEDLEPLSVPEIFDRIALAMADNQKFIWLVCDMAKECGRKARRDTRGQGVGTPL